MYTDYSEEKKDENLYEDEKKPEKEKIKKIVFFVLIFCVLVIVILIIAKSCSSSSTNSKTSLNDAKPSVTLNRQEISLQVDETYTLYYDILNSNLEKPTVAWYSEDSSIATVNNEGIVTGKKEGTTNIVALYNQKGEVYTSKCSVVVTTKVITLEAIKILQENIILKKGNAPVLLQVALSPVQASNQKLIFKSDNPSIATVNEEGYVNAIDIGTTTITVSSEDGKISDSISVEVGEKVTTINPTNIELISLTKSVTVGKTISLYPKILPSNATNQTVTWSSTNPSVATVSNGVVKGIKPGTCTIMASTSNNLSATVDITVISDIVAVSSISILDGTSYIMQVGGTKLLTYAISPSNATNKKVKITSSNQNVAVVDSNGIIAGVGVGNSLITVTTEDGNKTAFLNLTVTSSSSGSSGSSSGSSGSSSGSSGSSSGSSGSSSGSSGSSSGSSGSSSGSSGSSETTTCKASSITDISHNGPSQAISLKSFANSKAFTANAKITFNDVASCINNKFNYVVYRGTSANSVSDTDTYKYKEDNGLGKGAIITLSENGYYILKVTGVSTTGETLSKKYYVIVQKNDKTKPTVSITMPNKTSTSASIKFTVSDKGGIKSIKYCFVASNSSTKCPPEIELAVSVGIENYDVTRVLGFNANSKLNVCANASDVAGNIAETVCKTFSK